jgi:tetratricopeptide (TPR) repeat protein
LIEGSVRKEGDRVRIAVELIGASNGVNIWTESYDRQLTGIFAIQEDIATAIAGALRMPLGLKSGQGLLNNHTINPEAYDRYLRAKALIRARFEITGLVDATNLLDDVVARSPDFAPGWAQLALGYVYTPQFHPAWLSGSPEAREIVDRSLSKAEVAARRAVELDPNLAEAYLPLGLAQSARGNFSNAEEFYAKALVLDPDNSDALQSYSYMLAGIGYLKKALPMRQHLQNLEPSAFTEPTGEVLWVNGQNDAALTMYKVARNSANAARGIAQIYAAEGRYSEAADALEQGNTVPAPAQEAARLLRTAPAKAASPQTLPRLGIYEFVYAYIGAAERMLDAHEVNLQSGYALGASNVLLWQSSYASVRKTERFKALVKKAGMVDYWRAKGWPDLCHPVGSDDFACD